MEVSTNAKYEKCYRTITMLINYSNYTIVVKGCGDYEFLSRMYGILGASGELQYSIETYL